MKFKVSWASRSKLQPFALLCASLCLPSFGFSQQSKLFVVPPADAVSVQRGASVVIPLKVTTLPGFHVNSDKPRGEYLIPFKVSWTSGPLQTTRITYPEPHMMKVGPDTLSVFTGSFVVQTEVTAPADAATGPVSLVGKVHYQACNDQMCFRPANAEVKVPVTVR